MPERMGSSTVGSGGCGESPGGDVSTISGVELAVLSEIAEWIG